jgi:hypothetical protein
MANFPAHWAQIPAPAKLQASVISTIIERGCFWDTLLLVPLRDAAPLLIRFSHGISLHAISVFVIILRVRTLDGCTTSSHWTYCWIIIVDF